MQIAEQNVFFVNTELRTLNVNININDTRFFGDLHPSTISSFNCDFICEPLCSKKQTKKFVDFLKIR